MSPTDHYMNHDIEELPDLFRKAQRLNHGEEAQRIFLAWYIYVCERHSENKKLKRDFDFFIKSWGKIGGLGHQILKILCLVCEYWNPWQMDGVTRHIVGQWQYLSDPRTKVDKVKVAKERFKKHFPLYWAQSQKAFGWACTLSAGVFYFTPSGYVLPGPNFPRLLNKKEIEDLMAVETPET